MALKKNNPAIRFSGYKVGADELDIVRDYIVLNPTVSATWFGTAASDAAVAVAPLNNGRADYPRNLLLTILGVAGGQGGTIVANGKDQFGNVIQESIGFATANGGGTAAGTKVFAEYTSGTVTPVGLGGTAVGTVSLGVVIGSVMAPLFGLPDKLGGTSDVKAVTWIDADTAKTHGAATHANVAQSAIQIEVAGGIAAADSFVIRYRPTFVNEENIQKL